jgi:hypothetical protein
MNLNDHNGVGIKPANFRINIKTLPWQESQEVPKQRIEHRHLRPESRDQCKHGKPSD